jgi:hypothetical protein
MPTASAQPPRGKRNTAVGARPRQMLWKALCATPSSSVAAPGSPARIFSRAASGLGRSLVDVSRRQVTRTRRQRSSGQHHRPLFRCPGHRPPGKGGQQGTRGARGTPPGSATSPGERRTRQHLHAATAPPPPTPRRGVTMFAYALRRHPLPAPSPGGPFPLALRPGSAVRRRRAGEVEAVVHGEAGAMPLADRADTSQARSGVAGHVT